MSEQVLNIIISRIENMGYELGGEAVQLLQQYYPIVKRKLIIEYSLWLFLALVATGIAAYLFYKSYKLYKEDAYNNWEPPLVLGSLLGIISIPSLFGVAITLLNIRYYVIETIIEQIF